MKDRDFEECRFIKEELRFLFYKDFLRDCFIIRKYYKELSNNGKIFYKWFIYANIHTTIGQKNAMWDFLNEESIDTYNKLVELR